MASIAVAPEKLLLPALKVPLKDEIVRGTCPPPIQACQVAVYADVVGE
jgi:hypothetical protein